MAPAAVRGDDIQWVGYQGCADGAPAASFHDGQNWFNFLVPSEADRAVFGSGFDPQDNGMPHEIYFGDFCHNTFPCPFTYYFSADSASVLELLLQDEDWTFDLGWGALQCDPPEHTAGSLTAARITVGSDVWSTGQPGSASVTFKNGRVYCTDFGIGGFPGSEGQVFIVGAETQLTCSGFLDILDGSVWMNSGARLTAFVLRAGDGGGTSTRQLTVSDTGTSCAIDHLAIGNGGSGRVVITSGADVDCGFLKMGDYGGANTSCLVTGAGTTLVLRPESYIPMWTDALFEIANSAYVYSPALAVDHGRVRVFDGGELSTDNASLGEGDHLGSAEVSGAGSRWTLTDWLKVGEWGPGTLVVREGGEVRVGYDVRIPDREVWSGETTVEGTGSFLGAGGVIWVGDQAPGVLRIQDGGVVEAYPLLVGAFGSVVGNGLTQGWVLNDGVVSPGASPGFLDVSGDFEQTANGRLEIEIAGTQAGTEFDQLRVAGVAQLAGTLEVSLIDGYEPIVGQEFEVLAATSVVGEFDAVSSSEGDFLATYEPHRVLVTFLQAVDTPAIEETSPLAFRLAIAGHNPVRMGQSLRVVMDATAAQGPVGLDLFGVDGRIARSWDPHLTGGSRREFTLPASALDVLGGGVYFLRMRASGAETTQRLVIAR